jgi:hypothetical protein
VNVPLRLLLWEMFLPCQIHSPLPEPFQPMPAVSLPQDVPPTATQSRMMFPSPRKAANPNRRLIVPSPSDIAEATQRSCSTSSDFSSSGKSSASHQNWS